MSPLLDETPARVLAVYAHPDDPQIAAGGTLARWAGAGAQVWVLIATRGDKGSAQPRVDADALARLRLEETAAATEALGLAGHFNLPYPDGELPDDQELRREITRYLRELRPDVVVCPDPTAVFFGDSYFNHHDHRVIGWATLDAVAPAAANPNYFPEHHRAGLEVHRVQTVLLSATLEPNCWVDIVATLEQKIDAVFRHASQLSEGSEWLGEFIRESARNAGGAVGVAHAEAFRRLTLGPAVP